MWHGRPGHAFPGRPARVIPRAKIASGMEKRKSGAVAVDLGASSARFAAGWLEEGRINFEIICQIPHAPLDREGGLVWDFDALVRLTREAADYAAAHFERSTIGIDSW